LKRAAALYRRSLLESVGGFDPDFFLIYEDADDGSGNPAVDSDTADVVKDDHGNNGGRATRIDVNASSNAFRCFMLAVPVHRSSFAAIWQTAVHISIGDCP